MIEEEEMNSTGAIAEALKALLTIMDRVHILRQEPAGRRRVIDVQRDLRSNTPKGHPNVARGRATRRPGINPPPQTKPQRGALIGRHCDRPDDGFSSPFQGSYIAFGHPGSYLVPAPVAGKKR